MRTYEDVKAMVRGPIPDKPLPVVYDFAPCFDAMVGGIPNLVSYYFDTDEKIRLQTKLKELFPEALVLPGVFPDFGVVAEVSAFGGQMLWSAGNAPYNHPCLRDLKDVDTLKIPEPGTTGLTAPMLAQKKLMRKKMADRGLELERWTLTMGPAEIAGLLLGYDKFYMGLYDDPKRLGKLMEMAAEFVIGWIRAQGEVTGGNDLIMVADHVCSQVQPAHLREFIQPLMKAIFSEFPEAIRIYHNEGRHSDEHIQLILGFGAEVWHFGSDVHEIGALYDKIGDAIVPWGGLNPHGAIRIGTPDQVQAEARTVVEKAKGRRLLLSTGTGTTPDAPLANVRAMVETAIA
jgi:uroporphyrinogen decarboxylase